MNAIMRRSLVLLATVLATIGIAQTVAAEAVNTTDEWMIFRANDNAGGQVHISQSGKLHAALAEGEYTVLRLCANDANFDVAVFHPGRANRGELSVSAGNRLDANAKAFQLTVGANGLARASFVDKGEVKLDTLQLHRRIVSRVVSHCDTAPAVAVAPVHVAALPLLAEETRSLELASDSLFPFASFDLEKSVARSLVRARFEQLVPKQEIGKITHIRVIGHSDPVGQPHRKELVSLSRASAVARYLQSEFGLPVHQFSVETQSDKQLLVSDCPSQPTSVRNACNAPNRRVEVMVRIKN